MQQFVSQLIDSHNKLRHNHGVQVLRLSDDLSGLAQNWADELALRDEVENDSECHALELGENLFVKVVSKLDSEISGEEVAQQWYSEMQNYTWSGNGGQLQCRNFTQLVWKSTAEAGFGLATSNTGRLYVVGRYRPRGNCSGHFHRNVLLPRNTISYNNGLLQSCRADAALRKEQEVLVHRNTRNNNTSAKKFVAQLLVAHNEYRSMHQSPPLRMNDELAKLAQSWADVLATRDALAYDPKCDKLAIGENVARKCDIHNAEATAQEFVDTWYSEVQNFNWRSLEDQFGCSHFAQLVWRASREAGFGRAVSMSGCVYVVGRYRPRGNNPGEFPRNVLPLLPMKVSRESTGSTRMKRGLGQEESIPSTGEPIVKVVLNRARTAPAVSSKFLFASVSTRDKDAAASATEPPPASPEPKETVAASRPSERPSDTKDRASAASPMSSMGLFSSLASRRKEDGGEAPPAAGSSPMTKGLFATLASKSSPMTAANILQQTLVSHTKGKAIIGEDAELEPVFNIRKFTTQMLVSHNEYRSQHRVPPLRLNSDLSRLAQDWADVLAIKDKLSHDLNCSVVDTGENVAMKFRVGETNFPGDVFTDIWYEEIEAYDWNSNAPQPDCDHFTQVVWKSTSEVGFGRAVSDTGRVYVVGRYRPPGNHMGEYKRNVLRSADDLEPQEAQAAAEPPRPALAVRDFGGPTRRSVTFNDTEGSKKPSVSAKSLHGFLPQKGAVRSSTVSSGSSNKAAPPVSPLSAMLLSRTLQQHHMRAPEKKMVKASDEHTFNIKKFENQLLVSHNEYRALHRSPPLRLNAELSKLAQAWAVVLSGKDKMAHDPKCSSLGLGENVAMKFRKGSTIFPGDLFTELWYHEIDQYKWTGEDQLACGHFTQLVWRSSTEVGFGRAVAKSGRVYVVGRYKPPGNYSGQFGRNVLPPSRVMPKSRNNNPTAADKVKPRSHSDSECVGVAVGGKSDARTLPKEPEASELEEYAGFGTARVAESRRSPPARARYRLELTERAPLPGAPASQTSQARVQTRPQQQQEEEAQQWQPDHSKQGKGSRG